MKFFRYYIQNIATNKTHIMIASFPKSGGTFLSAILKNLPKMRRVNLTLGTDRREHELSNEKLILYHKKNYVAGSHTRCSSITEELIDFYKLTPIILVRNIFDIVPSLYDHFKKESPIIPMAYVPNDLIKWDKDRAFDFIIDMVLPWYFNFYVSWSNYNNKLILTYDEVTSNTKSTIQKVIRHTKMKISEQEIENAITLAQTKEFIRLNVGVTGRGKTLSSEQKKKIKKMARYYEGINFSLIGL